MIKSAISAAALAVLLSAPAARADVGFGFGFTFIFGGDVAFGGKVFSTDKPESAALSLGVDYKLTSGSFRPNVGVAYLDEDFYVDLNAGYDINAGDMDFGIGAGGLGNMRSPGGTMTITPPGPGGT